MPRRYDDYASWNYPNWYENFNGLFIVGMVVLILQAVFVVNLVYTAFRGRKA